MTTILVEILISLFLLSGSVLILLAAVGVTRFLDPLCRSHALAKASSLGICLMLGGLWIAMDDEITGLKVLLVMVFSLLTIPMAGHLIALYIYNIQDIEVTLKPNWPNQEEIKTAPEATTGKAPDSAKI